MAEKALRVVKKEERVEMGGSKVVKGLPVDRVDA